MKERNTAMKKVLTVLLMFNLLVLLLSACADEQMEINPQQIDETIATELVQPSETEQIAEDMPTPEPLQDPIQDIETIEVQDVTDDPQTTTISTPTETSAPIATPKPMQPQIPAATPKPTQSTSVTPQAPSQTPTPAPQPTQEPVQQPAPTPQPTPQPTPEPALQPTPQPAPPPPPVAEPPPARTICNTCGADITGNVAAHGTGHMLNDENFSYRVE